MEESLSRNGHSHQYKMFFYPPGGILIWIIIFLELITFSMGLIALVIFSKEDPDLFHKSRLTLNMGIGALNTIVLLSSGFCMAQAIHFIKNEKKCCQYVFIFLFLKSCMLRGKCRRQHRLRILHINILICIKLHFHVH